MLRRTLTTTVLTALTVSSLVLAACGADEATTETSSPPACPGSALLDAVDVSGDDGEQPELDFDQPLAVEATSCRVLTQGHGDALTDGATGIFDYVFVNGRDGSEISSSYGQERAEVVLNDELMAGVRLGLDGAKAGSRLLVAIAPADGFGPQGDDPEIGLKADDTLLLFVEVHEVRTPLLRAEGTAVDPRAGLPTVELATDGAPTIALPEGDPPAELVVQPLIKGTGATVKTGQTITVHYTGVLWDTGEEFDSSWKRGAPASFPIGTGGVIPGWDKGLVGQKVGSQVLLVIPPADGYPEGSGSIPAGATLVFVVDILDAHS